jgi:hypothetical protein
MIVTILSVNKLGKRLEKFEARIYQRISGKHPEYIKYDKSGIPIVVYEGGIGEEVTVVLTAQEALNYYKNISDTISRNKFFACIDWLKSNSTRLNDSSIIFYVNFDWPGFNMKKPWRSAMNQGRAIQAFLKAFEFTNDSIYLRYAKESMNTLLIQVKDGGVSYIDTTGYWYEEYADDNVPQSRVLNGMIVVLQSLSDYYKVTKDPKAFFLFNEGVRSVKNTLKLYDNNGHSNYDILGKPASSWYHNFHIKLLDYLYTETHEPLFNEYKLKWSEYKEPTYLSTFIKKPTRIGVFMVLSLFLAIFSIVFGTCFLVLRLEDKKVIKGIT